MKVLSRSAVLVVMLGASTACVEGDVRFGPPGGLRIRGNATVTDACPLPVGVSSTPSAAECAVPEASWQGHIFPKYFDASDPINDPMMQTTGIYLCANAGCHEGPNDTSGVNMVSRDASASYAALAAFENGGRTYFGGADAYVMCNIDAATTVPYGAPMPKGKVVTPGDLAEIGLWVACGMIDDSTPGSTVGAGGAGGAVGAGGAGGGG